MNYEPFHDNHEPESTASGVSIRPHTIAEFDLPRPEAEEFESTLLAASKLFRNYTGDTTSTIEGTVTTTATTGEKNVVLTPDVDDRRVATLSIDGKKYILARVHVYEPSDHDVESNVRSVTDVLIVFMDGEDGLKSLKENTTEYRDIIRTVHALLATQPERPPDTTHTTAPNWFQKVGDWVANNNW